MCEARSWGGTARQLIRCEAQTKVSLDAVTDNIGF
jgi:hypothetical protein